MSLLCRLFSHRYRTKRYTGFDHGGLPVPMVVRECRWCGEWDRSFGDGGVLYGYL
jgi:hypothetical protein